MLATACGGGGSDADEGSSGDSGGGGMTEVRTAAPAPVPPGFPSYWLAEGYGFYAEECLDVEQVDPGQAAAASLQTDRLDMAGIDFATAVPMAAGQGDAGVRAFMVTDLQPFLFVTFEDSGLESIADLEGKTIGINEPHDETDARFLLSSAGLSEGDYELVPVGEDRPALLALERGDVAAFMGAFRGANTSLPDLASKPLKLLETESSTRPYHGAVMATEQYLEENRETAVGFGRALVRAMIWQWENPELSAEIMMEQSPESAEDVEQMQEFLEVGSAYHQPLYDDMFRFSGERLQDYVDNAAELGVIEESFDASTLYTDDLIDDILDFDVEAEKEAAREATEAPPVEADCG